MLGLDTAKSLQFFKLHGDMAAETDLAGSTLDERDAVRVQIDVTCE